MTNSRNRGFTLIELVVVITILGILAAFAVPKFITLDSTARAATINGLAGSVKSAASLARGISMASQTPTTALMEGVQVALVSNYPDVTLAGIGSAVNTSTSDFTFTPGTSGTGTATWAKVGAPGTCQVTYALSATAGAAPAVVTTLTGC